MDYHFKFFNDLLTVHYTGSTWISPCNGQEHARHQQAVQAECKHYLESCGSKVEDYQDKIDQVELWG